MIADKKTFGYLNLAIAQCAIGLNVVAGKYLIHNMPVFVFVGGRFFCSSLLLILTTLLLKKPSRKTPVGPKTWAAIALQALFGGLLFNLLFMIGVKYTTATAASVIGSTLPALIAIFAFFILGKP